VAHPPTPATVAEHAVTGASLELPESDGRLDLSNRTIFREGKNEIAAG
jgi:hypothetical protein